MLEVSKLLPWQPININPCEIFLLKYFLYWKCYVGGKFHWNWKRCADDLIHIFSGFCNKTQSWRFLLWEQIHYQSNVIGSRGQAWTIHLSAPQDLQHREESNERHNTVRSRPEVVCVTPGPMLLYVTILNSQLSHTFNSSVSRDQTKGCV